MSDKIINFPHKKDSWLGDLPPIEETEMFTFEDGVVTISSRKGEELTLAKGLFMLEMVKDEIMRLARKDNF